MPFDALREGLRYVSENPMAAVALLGLVGLGLAVRNVLPGPWRVHHKLPWDEGNAEVQQRTIPGRRRQRRIIVNGQVTDDKIPVYDEKF